MGAQDGINGGLRLPLIDAHVAQANPINRYLINSPMLTDLKKNDKGETVIYMQQTSPGSELESNWLPAQAVASTTFFHDDQGRPWKDADTFRDAFNAVRNDLAMQHASFETRYYVGLDPDNPLSLPTRKLTMRTMRHTCITLNHDAAVPRELIRAITGHELDTIGQVLKCYAATTADQAAEALNIRLAYERKAEEESA